MEATRVLEEIIELFKHLWQLGENTAECQARLKEHTLTLIGRLTYERELRRTRPGSYVRGQTDATIYGIMELTEQLKVLRRGRLETYTKIRINISKLVNEHVQLAMLHVQN